MGNLDDLIDQNRELKHNEREEHDKSYGSHTYYRSATTIQGYLDLVRPPWEQGGILYGEEIHRLIETIKPELDRAITTKGAVLDYCCGLGEFSVHMALRGVHHIEAFDISEEGLKHGRALAADAGVAKKINFRVMDASKLEYPDNTFDFVIGKGVLHHVVKYENTATELLRVLKPGGSAWMIENLGNGPWKLIRAISLRLQDELGDVNLTSPLIQEWARPFGGAEIYGFHFLFLGKRLLFNGAFDLRVPVLRRAQRRAMKLAYKIDERLVNHGPLANALGGACFIKVTKPAA